MSPGDYIEFAVQLANMNGIVNLDTLVWENPLALDINETERDALSYNKELKLLQGKGDRKMKIQCSTNRLCEIEDAVVEWIQISLLDQPKISIDVANFTPPNQ